MENTNTPTIRQNNNEYITIDTSIPRLIIFFKPTKTITTKLKHIINKIITWN